MSFDRACTCVDQRTRGITLLALLSAFSACGGDSPTDTVDPPDPVATEVTLSEQQVPLTSLGQTYLLTASVNDQTGALMASAPVTWSSSDDDVATVAPNGVVTAVANGSSTISAASGSASATSTATVEQVGVSVEFAQLFVELDAVGDAANVETTVRDARDHLVLDPSLEWMSTDSTVAEVSGEGVVTAMAEGVAAVTATVTGTGSGGSVGSTPASASISVFVGTRVLLVTGTQPSVLVEGSPAVIEGVGFSPVAADNTVTLAGLPAQVTAASATTLDIVVPLRDCQPVRQEELVVDVLGANATSSAGMAPADPVHLEIGDGVFTTDGCLPLVAGTGGEQYLVGALSTSETASGLTLVEIEGAVGEVLVVSPPLLASGAGKPGLASSRERAAIVARGAFSAPIEPGGLSSLRIGDASVPAFALQARPDHRSGEAAVRRRDRAILRALGRAPSPAVGDPRRASGDGPFAAVPSVGEILNLNVSSSCTDAVSVQAVVRHVGTAGVWLEDVDNPMQSFMVQEYQAFDALLAQDVVPKVTSYFGPFEDIDGNGRTLILVTKEVNERPNVLGFVQGLDLFPPISCSTSNFAEIFYGIAPDPDGLHGDVFTTQAVLDLYPSLIAHELTHVSQLSQYVYGTADLKATWELEGGATLTEQLVGFEILGHGPGQDLGYAEWNLGYDDGWYSDWVLDLASYFGWLGDTQAVGAPEECSWVAREEDGNNGPCFNGRAPYGTPATLLRWVLDEYGPSYPGGETALMRELTGSAQSGFSTLTEATGESTAYLLTSFAVGLWADGRLGDWLPSWDLFDIFQNFVSALQLNPYTSSSAAPSLEVSVRAGSSAYLEWSPPGPHAPTSLRLRAPAGGAAASHMVLWVLRIS